MPFGKPGMQYPVHTIQATIAASEYLDVPDMSMREPLIVSRLQAYPCDMHCDMSAANFVAALSCISPCLYGKLCWHHLKSNLDCVYLATLLQCLFLGMDCK